jgi:glycosyltransferase involved in cell wall biosynthesis
VAHFLRRMRRAGLVLTQVCHEFTERDRPSGRVDPPGIFDTFSAIFLHGAAHRAAFLALYDVPESRCISIPHGNEALLASVDDRGGDLRGRYGIPPGRPVALFFGGLRPSKGLDDLLDAFAMVLQELPAALVIAGAPQGIDGADLIARSRRLGIDESVTVDARYLPLEEVGPVLRTADVVVLPYRTASASGALQAAYAFGRPVIGTDAGALPEAIEPGVTGLVVPVGRPDLLARAMIKLLSDPAEAGRMGAAAQRVAEDRFSWRPIARTVLAASQRAEARR